MRARNPKKQRSRSKPSKTVDAFLSTQGGWRSLRDFVSEQPKLLDEAVVRELSATAQACLRRGDTAQAAVVRQRYRFLIRCRELGVERAYQSFSLDPGPDAPSELRHCLQSLANCEPIAGVARWLDRYQTVLSLLDREKSPYLYGAVQYQLGCLLTCSPAGELELGVEAAIRAFKLALDVYTPAEAPLERMDALGELGSAYLLRPRGTRAYNVESALDAYQEAFTLVPKEKYPVRWGQLCRLSGRAYRERVQGYKGENAEKAVALLQQAVQLHMSADLPDEWAADYLELGQAYLARRAGDPGENVDLANEAAAQALEVYSPESDSIQSALTLRLLAAIYARAGVEAAPSQEAASPHDMLAQAIAYLEKDQRPAEYAAALNQLAGLYEEGVSGERADNLEQAIRYYGVLVESPVMRAACPHEWAKAAYGLAVSYRQRLVGDAAHNQERAMGFARQASLVFAQQHMVMDLGLAKILMAALHADSARADEAEAQEQTIMLLEDGLQQLGPKADPGLWAEGMLSLSKIYSRHKHNPASYERAIEVLERTLTILTQEQDSFYQAIVSERLAALYLERASGNQKENVETALTLITEASAVQSQDSDAQQWAENQLLLARALVRSAALGEPDENRQRAIEACQNALTVYTPAEHPHDRVLTLMTLAEAFLDRADGERADNIDAAITTHQEILQLLAAQKWFEELSMSFSQLAKDYLIRIHGDPEENIEEAIRLLREGEKIADAHGESPEYRAARKQDLAAAYEVRVRGDTEENLDRALGLLDKAVKDYTEQGLHLKALDCMVGIARIWADHPRETETDSKEKAIALLIDIRKALPAEHLPKPWAVATETLASLYSDRTQGDQRANEERAIELLQETLTVYQRETHPEHWARIQHMLGNCYGRRSTGDRAQNIELGITFLESALSFQTENRRWSGWAPAQKTLGHLLANRETANELDNQRRAIECLTQAREVLDERIAPIPYSEIELELSNIYFKKGQTEKAASCLHQAIQALKSCYQQVQLNSGKRAIADSVDRLYRVIAGRFVQLGRLREAVVTLELSRARGLGDALTRDQADLDRIAALDRAAYSQYMRAVMWLRQIEVRELGIATHLTWDKSLASLDVLRSQTRQARDELNAAIQRIRVLPGWQDFLQDPSWEDCAAAVVTHGGQQDPLPPPLVYLIPLAGGSLSILLRPAQNTQDVQLESFWFTDLPDESVAQLLIQESFDKNGEGEYHGYVPGIFSLDSTELDAALAYMLPALGQRLMGPLADRLRGEFDSVALIPCSLLGQLPLHAALYTKDGRECALLDEFAISYAPSARVLAKARLAAACCRNPPTLGGVANPLPHSRPLPLARDELEAIALHFPMNSRNLLFEHQATREATLTMLPSASHLHLSCHGRFAPFNPLNSSLELSNEESLTLYDILNQEPLDQTRLVVLSACQTGVSDVFHLADGLSWPTAFLRLGVPGIIGTCWPATTGATALLMAKFYELLFKGDGLSGGRPTSPAQALCSAQRWLRALTWEEAAIALGGASAGLGPGSSPAPGPFNAPLYWAPFIFVGA